MPHKRIGRCFLLTDFIKAEGVITNRASIRFDVY